MARSHGQHVRMQHVRLQHVFNAHDCLFMKELSSHRTLLTHF